MTTPFNIHERQQATQFARKEDKLKRVPVKILFNSSRHCETIRKIETDVIAKTAEEAANWVRDRLYDVPETEIYAWGPKGGEYYRYIGWESAIGDTLIRGERSSEEILQAIRDLDPAYDNDWRNRI